MKKPKKLIGACIVTILPLCASAQPPHVVTDITPVHSIVSQVMEGVGTPDLLVQSGASPHGYSLSPSEAEALQQADLVFWIGEGLTPWLENSLETLALDAKTIELLEVRGTTTHPYRTGATFESHDHNDGDHSDEHDEHDEHEKVTHGHDHEGVDPHAWLDPVNAKVWLDEIAETLARKDPENAQRYMENASAGKHEIDAVISKVEVIAGRLENKQFIVFHDAYQYFERRFDIPAAGAISIGDASKPSPARIAEIRELVAELDVSCVFTEPQYNPGIVKAVFGGTGVRTSGVMDPLGANLPIGAELYPDLLSGIADNLELCLENG